MTFISSYIFNPFRDDGTSLQYEWVVAPLVHTVHIKSVSVNI